MIDPPEPRSKEERTYKQLRPDVFVVDFSVIDRAITDAIRNVRKSPSNVLLPWLRVDLEYEGCMELARLMKTNDIFQQRKLFGFLLDRISIPPDPNDVRIIEQFAEVDRSNFFTGLNKKITRVLCQYVLTVIRPLACEAAKLVQLIPDDRVHAHLVKSSVTEGTFYKSNGPHRLLKGTFLEVNGHLEVDRAPKVCCVKAVPRDYGFAVFQNSARSVTYGYAVFKPCVDNDDILHAYFFLDPTSESSMHVRLHPNQKANSLLTRSKASKDTRPATLCAKKVESCGFTKALLSRDFYAVAFEKSDLGASGNAFQFLSACYCAPASSSFSVSIERSDFGALSADIIISQDPHSLGLGVSSKIPVHHIDPEVHVQDLMFSNAECSFFGIHFNLFFCLHLVQNFRASSFTIISIHYALVPVSGDLLPMLSVKFAHPSNSVDDEMLPGNGISFGEMQHLGKNGLKAAFSWEHTIDHSEMFLMFPPSRFLCVDFFASSNSITAVEETKVADVFFTPAPAITFAQFMGLSGRQYLVKSQAFMSLPLEMQVSMHEFCTPTKRRTVDFALCGAILASNQINRLQLGNFLMWHSFETDRVDLTFLDNVIKSFSSAFSSEFKSIFSFWYKEGRCLDSHMQITIYSMPFWFEKFKTIFNHCNSEFGHLSDHCTTFQMRMQEMHKLTRFADVTGYLEYLKTAYNSIPPDVEYFEQDRPLVDSELVMLELRWLRDVDITRLIELSESRTKMRTLLPRFPYDGKFVFSIWDETIGRNPRKVAFIEYCSVFFVDRTSVVSFFDGLATRRDRREKSVIKYILELQYNLRDIQKIGQGGEASVFKCRHGESKIFQAAKVFALTNEHSLKVEADAQYYQKENRKRIREARQMQRCKYSGIVKINDLFCSGDPVVILMEYLDGLPLNVFLEKWVRGDLPDNLCGADSPKYTGNTSIYLNVVLDFVAQLCHSVSWMHKNGIIHADLSFGNVMIVREVGKHYSWCTKIVDFGLAKDVNRLTDLSLTDVTAYAANKGTPFFMSPERKNGQGRKMSDDVWSLGVMFFMMIFQHPTGQTGWCLDKQHCFYEDAGIVVNLIDVRKLREAAKMMCYSRNDSCFMYLFQVCSSVFFEVNPTRSNLNLTANLDSPLFRLIDAECLLSVLQKAACESVYDVCFLSDNDSRSLMIKDLKQRLERQMIGNRNFRCTVLSLADPFDANSVSILDSLIFVPLMTIPECSQNEQFIALLQLACRFCKMPHVGTTPRFRGAVRLLRIVPVLCGFDQVHLLENHSSLWSSNQTNSNTVRDLIAALMGRYVSNNGLSASGKMLKISDEFIDEIKDNLNVFQILREHVPDKSFEELVVVPDVDSGRHRMMQISKLISSHVKVYWGELLGFDNVANPTHLLCDDALCQEYSVRSEGVRFNVALWLGRFHFILLMLFYCWIYQVHITQNLGLLRSVWKFDGASSTLVNSSITYKFTMLVNTSTNLVVQERYNVNDSTFHVHSRQCWVTGLDSFENRERIYACDHAKHSDYLSYCVSFDDENFYTEFLNRDRFEQLFFIQYESRPGNCSIFPLVENFFNLTESLCPVHYMLDRIYFIRWAIAVTSIVVYVCMQRSQRLTSSENKNLMINACGRYSVVSQFLHSLCGFLCVIYLLRLDNAVRYIHPPVPVVIEYDATWYWIVLEFIASVFFTCAFKILKDFLSRLEFKENMRNCTVTKLCKFLKIKCLSPNDDFDFQTDDSAAECSLQLFCNRIRQTFCHSLFQNQYGLLRSESEHVELEMSGGHV
jgi:serine/threonine protein kinase